MPFTDGHVFFMASGNRRSGKGRRPKPKKKPMKFEKKKRRGNPHSSDREQKMKAFASLEEGLTDDDVGVKECHFCGVPEHLHTECLKCDNMMCGDEDGSICWMWHCWVYQVWWIPLQSRLLRMWRRRFHTGGLYGELFEVLSWLWWLHWQHWSRLLWPLWWGILPLLWQGEALLLRDGASRRADESFLGWPVVINKLFRI